MNYEFPANKYNKIISQNLWKNNKIKKLIFNYFYVA